MTTSISLKCGMLIIVLSGGCASSYSLVDAANTRDSGVQEKTDATQVCEMRKRVGSIRKTRICDSRKDVIVELNAAYNYVFEDSCTAPSCGENYVIRND